MAMGYLGNRCDAMGVWCYSYGVLWEFGVAAMGIDVSGSSVFGLLPPKQILL